MPRPSREAAAANAMPASLDEAVGQLEAELKKNPDQAEGWRLLGRSYLSMERYPDALRAFQTAQKLQTECNKVIDLLIKTGVFRGLKTVLHYMDVVSVPLCRKPFGPVDEKYLPELKALAQQLMQERG